MGSLSLQPCLIVKRERGGKHKHDLRFIFIKEAVKKLFFKELFLNKGGGVGIPRLYVKFWWLLFLAIKITFLFLNLTKIQFFYS